MKPTNLFGSNPTNSTASSSASNSNSLHPPKESGNKANCARLLPEETPIIVSLHTQPTPKSKRRVNKTSAKGAASWTGTCHRAPRAYRIELPTAGYASSQGSRETRFTHSRVPTSTQRTGNKEPPPVAALPAPGATITVQQRQVSVNNGLS